MVLAFHPSIPVIIPRRRRALHFISPRRVFSCKDRSPINDISNVSSKPVKQSRLPIKSPPAFLQRPDAVFAVLAVGFLTSIAYLANISRRIFYDVRKRAQQIAMRESYGRRHQAQLRQKLYLESAIEATQATIANTEVFLEKQIQRAEAVEGRLEEFSASAREVDRVMEHVSLLKLDLMDQEQALSDEQKNLQKNEEVVSNLQEGIENRKQMISTFDQQLSDLRGKLQASMKEAQRTVEQPQDSITQHEKRLNEHDEHLRDELLQTDRLRERKERFEKELSGAVSLFETQMSGIEARREEIKAVSSKARQLEKVTAEGRKSLEVCDNEEIEDLQAQMERMWSERDALAKEIEKLKEEEDVQFTTRDALMKELKERSNLVAELSDELNILKSAQTQERNRKPTATSLSFSADPSSTVFRELNSTADAFSWDGLGDVSLDDLNVENFEGEGEKFPPAEKAPSFDQDHHEKLSSTSRSFDIVESAVREQDARMQAQIVTDNFMGSDALSIVEQESLREVASVKVKPRTAKGQTRNVRRGKTEGENGPKRKRGRPRKKPIESPTQEDKAPPKRKRGRPRKSSSSINK